MRNSRTVTVLAVISLLLSACGGETGNEDPGTTVASPTTTGVPGTTAAPSTTTDPGGGVGGLPTACLNASQAMAAAVQAYGQAFAGPTPGLEDIAVQLQAMADAAPAEIRDDFDVMAREVGGIYQALADIGLVLGATPTPEQIEQLNALSDQIDEDALDEAAANIEAWFEDNCGG